MRAHLDWVVRTVVAPVVLGCLTVAIGTLGYVLVCPGVYWLVGGRTGDLPSFLFTAGLVGALLGAGLGLCIAADRAGGDDAARPPSRPPLAAPGRRWRRPRTRYGRERRAVRFRPGGCANSSRHEATG